FLHMFLYALQYMLVIGPCKCGVGLPCICYIGRKSMNHPLTPWQQTDRILMLYFAKKDSTSTLREWAGHRNEIVSRFVATTGKDNQEEILRGLLDKLFGICFPFSDGHTHWTTPELNELTTPEEMYSGMVAALDNAIRALEG